jgi:uncharacterized protein (TIGR02284 family)
MSYRRYIGYESAVFLTNWLKPHKMAGAGSVVPEREYEKGAIMPNEINDIRSTLNGLIETLKDGEEGFRLSAAKAVDPTLRAQFQSLASQRASFASELQAEVAATGGEPAVKGSTSGAIHRGWVGLKTALTGKDDHAILVEAERGEDSAVKNYRSALGKDLPGGLRDVVDRQYRQVMIAHDQVRALRDGVRTTTAGAPRTY